MIIELILLALQLGAELLNPAHWSDRRESRALRKAERKAAKLVRKAGPATAADTAAA